MKGKRKRLLSLFLTAAITVTQMPGAAMAEADTPEDGVVASFAALEKDTAEQTVPLETELSELDLPDQLKAQIYRVSEETPDSEEEKPEGDEDSGMTGGEEATPGNAGAKEPEHDGNKEPVIKVSTFWDMVDVSWGSTPEYDGDRAGKYVFTASVSGYVLSEGARLPRITVTVEDGGQTVGPEKPDGDTVIITDFDELAEEVRDQSYPAGTERKEFELPETLTAYGFRESAGGRAAEDAAENPASGQPEPVVISRVVWEADIPYEGEDGVYVFTPVLPEGYTLAERAELPEIFVRIGNPEMFSVRAIGYLDEDVKAAEELFNYYGLEYDNRDVAGWKYVTWGYSQIYYNDAVKELKLRNTGLAKGLNLDNANKTGFRYLEKIDCSQNNLPSIKLLVNGLKELNCSYNQNLKSLVLAGEGNWVDSLTSLDCTSCGLTRLVLSNNVKVLKCSWNSLTDLGIGNQSTSLKEIDCGENKLTRLDLSDQKKLTKLDCSYNQLNSLILPDSDALTYLNCANNGLSGLGLPSKAKGLTYLDCSGNNLERLTLSGYTGLETVKCGSNKIKTFFTPAGIEVEIAASQTGGKISLESYNGKTNEVTFKVLPEKGFYLDTWELPDWAAVADKTSQTITFEIQTTEKFQVGAVIKREADADKDGYYDADVEAVNTMIRSNGLKAEPGDITGWDFAAWDGSTVEPKRITGLELSGKNLTGELNVADLTDLISLSCANNGLTALEGLDCLQKLEDLECAGNPYSFFRTVDGRILRVKPSGRVWMTSYDLASNKVELEARPASGEFFKEWKGLPAGAQKNGATAGFVIPDGETEAEAVMGRDDDQNDDGYHDGDVAVINKIIAENGLKEASDAPSSWTGFLTWTGPEGGTKRITGLSIQERGLTGTLEVSGLTELSSLNCSSNRLTALDLSGMKVRYLTCGSNPFTSFTSPEGRKLTVDSSENGSVMMRSYTLGTGEAELKADASLGYQFQRWEGLPAPADSKNPVSITLADQETKVRAVFEPKKDDADGDGYHDGDVAVINRMIKENGLKASPDSLKEWKFVEWQTRDNLNRATGLDIYDRGLTGGLTLTGLDQLYRLHCERNSLTKIDLTGLTGLTPRFNSTYCSGNDFSEFIAVNGHKLTILPPEGGGGTIRVEEYEPYTNSIKVKGYADAGYEFQKWTQLPDGAIQNPHDKLLYAFSLESQETIVQCTFKKVVDEHYNLADVESVNGIIETNKLNAKKDSPSEWGGFVTWDGSAKGARIISLDLADKNLTGSLDLSALTALTKLACGGNSLTGLDLTGLSALTELDFADNPCTVFTAPDKSRLTVESSAGGRAAVTGYNPESHAVTLAAVPDAGYGANGWKGLPEGASQSEDRKQAGFTLSGDRTVRAEFISGQGGLKVSSENGEVEYTEGEGYMLKKSGDYTITGTWDGILKDDGRKRSVISVSSGVTANVLLKDATIEVAGSDQRAFSTGGNGTVNLTLSGKNHLKGGSLAAGLEVLYGSKLVIDGNGSLEAEGAYGIGGFMAGAILIQGEVEVTANGNKVGIGGDDFIDSDSIIIQGKAKVEANCRGNGVGIGIRACGNGFAVNITIQEDAHVIAKSSGGAGIGGGDARSSLGRWDVGRITIQGRACVEAQNDTSSVPAIGYAKATVINISGEGTRVSARNNSSDWSVADVGSRSGYDSSLTVTDGAVLEMQNHGASASSVNLGKCEIIDVSSDPGVTSDWAGNIGGIYSGLTVEGGRVSGYDDPRGQQGYWQNGIVRDGVKVKVEAEREEGFLRWTSNPAVEFDSPGKTPASFTMPAEDTAVSAHADSITEGGLTVSSGNGLMEYTEGEGFALKESGDYTITGTWNGTLKNDNSYPAVITVSEDVTTANILLKDAVIEVAENYQGAFAIGRHNMVSLTLSGKNSLKSGIWNAGLQVSGGTKLVIDGDGSLEAEGASGIGSILGFPSGAICIQGKAEVMAKGSNAGIGGGRIIDPATDGIIIQGEAKVTAYSSGSGPGIGIGAGNSETSITIQDDAHVVAGSLKGAGIGGGTTNTNYTEPGRITIRGRAVVDAQTDGDIPAIGFVMGATVISISGEKTHVIARNNSSDRLNVDVGTGVGYDTSLTVTDGAVLEMQNHGAFASSVNLGKCEIIDASDKTGIYGWAGNIGGTYSGLTVEGGRVSGYDDPRGQQGYWQEGIVRDGVKVRVEADQKENFWRWSSSPAVSFINEEETPASFVMPEEDSVVKAVSGTAPAIDGKTDGSAAISLTEGYESQVRSFAVSGSPVPDIKIEPNTAQASFSGGELRIPEGLPAGTYTAVIKASNKIGSASMTVTVTVEPRPSYLLTVQAGAGGQVKGMTEGTYEKDTRILAEAVPDRGYQFNRWSFTPKVTFVDNTGETSPAVRFTMPDRAVTALAEFTPIKVTDVNLTQSTYTLYTNQAPKEVTLEARVLPADALNQTLSWESGNPEMATVDGNGKVTAIGNGTTAITVTTEDGGKKAVCTVTVETAVITIPVTGVSLDRTEYKLYTNKAPESVTLRAAVEPAEAANQTLSWESANPEVATVDGSGRVTALARGNTTITVTTEDGGYSVSCKIFVETYSDTHDDSDSGETVTYDKKKGHVDALNGIITGAGSGYSKWEQDETGWRLRYADGTVAEGTIITAEDGSTYEQPVWELVNGSWYAFGASEHASGSSGSTGGAGGSGGSSGGGGGGGSAARVGRASGYAKNGFVFDPVLGGYFYIDINTGMKTGWQLIEGKWYYFNPLSDGKKGIMLTDTWIDGWYVDQNGVWNGEPK